MATDQDRKALAELAKLFDRAEETMPRIGLVLPVSMPLTAIGEGIVLEWTGTRLEVFDREGEARDNVRNTVLEVQHQVAQLMPQVIEEAKRVASDRLAVCLRLVSAAHDALDGLEEIPSPAASEEDDWDDVRPRSE